MKKSKPESDKTLLRKSAEESRTADTNRLSPLPTTEVEVLRLLQELEVHQIELELQNDELQRARDETEALLTRYTELYDFAPVGYLTLLPDGSILQCNLAGAMLLGSDRQTLFRKRFGILVSRASRSEFNALMDRLRVGGSRTSCEIALDKNSDAAGWVHIEATVTENGQRYHLVLMDITERKRMEGKLDEHRELLQVSRDDLRKLTQHLQSVREEERIRLARELHDEIGHQLTVIKMNLFFIEKEIEGPDASRTLISEIHATSEFVSETIRTTQRIVRGLRPEILDTFGLCEALEFELKQFEKSTRVAWTLDLPEDRRVLDKHRSTAIYRIFQEALTNIARHANATSMHASIEFSETTCTLTVIDDGKGILPDDLLKGESFGILGMKERVAEFGGSLDISPDGKSGTVLKAVVPFTS